tara:strand:+ start:3857 stop:4285 length:429 start_codon:yes stop_codon:yes gene_type:complete
MSKNFDTIDESLDITPSEVLPEEKPVAKKKPVREEKPDIDRDYEYTRGHLYSLIEKGQEAIDGILELSQESDSPRAYEVAGQLIKNVADTTDKLMDLQKKLKDVNEESKRSPTNVTNNALFVGSTADLQKMLKQASKDNQSK